jgi:hypothetical protein
MFLRQKFDLAFEPGPLKPSLAWKQDFHHHINIVIVFYNFDKLVYGTCIYGRFFYDAKMVCFSVFLWNHDYKIMITYEKNVWICVNSVKSAHWNGNCLQIFIFRISCWVTAHQIMMKMLPCLMSSSEKCSSSINTNACAKQTSIKVERCVHHDALWYIDHVDPMQMYNYIINVNASVFIVLLNVKMWPFIVLKQFIFNLMAGWDQLLSFRDLGCTSPFILSSGRTLHYVDNCISFPTLLPLRKQMFASWCNRCNSICDVPITKICCGRVLVSTQAFQLHGHLCTLYFFSLFWGHVFFAFQHNLGTFCRGKLLKLVWISVAKIWSRSLILLFPQDNRTLGISGINLCHLGAELSILRCRKRFRGSINP